MQLLERHLHLKALGTALEEAEEEGRVALVYGEAGIGKTSLVEHFVKEQNSLWRILRGTCDLLFTPRPLGPLYDIAAQTQGGLLALLDSESKPEVIFSTCLNELKSQKTILFIEDVHWADEATLDLLKYLGRRIRQTTSLIILTYRDDEIGVDHPLRFLLGDLASADALHRIPVSFLTPEAVRELSKNKNVDPVSLHRLTNGNPFFVTEVLAVESGFPETVRDAVLARAAKLSVAARSLLEAGAVIGARVEPWLLSKITGAESAIVEECIATGMLHSKGDYYAFRHELARQAILESTSLERKLALHHLILAALKESPETSNDLARLANHAEGTKDASAVLVYAPAAAKQASALGAHRQAAAQYYVALQYATISTPEVRAELLDSYADECGLLDHRMEAKQAQEQALLIWRELGRREKEGRALRRLSEIDHEFLLTPEREQNIISAITMLETLPPSKELARAYSHMSRVHLSLNQTSGKDPIYWGSRAMELAEQLGDVETLAHALSSIGVGEMDIGRRVEGLAKLERSLKLSLDHGFQFHAARAFSNLANELKIVQDYAASLRYIKEGIEYCIQNDLDQWHMALLNQRARVRFQQGHWAEADQDLQTVLKFGRENESGEFLETQLFLLQLQARRGDPLSPEALHALRESLPKINELATKCEFVALFAELAWLKGDLTQCRSEAEPTFQMVSQNYGQLSTSNEFAGLSYWMWRAGAITESPPNTSEPYATQIAGDWRAAASMWEKFGHPYDQGMALMDGDETAQLAALEIFERLSAVPIMEMLKQKMRAEGIHIPRGPRPATRENPFGLTAREMEVLACLPQGSSNNAIAAKLSLSTRTVEHHIASILQKLQVQSRNEVVALILKENLLNSE